MAPRVALATLLLLLTAPAALSQSLFTDEAFGFSFEVPADMQLLEDSELRGFLNMPADVPLNPDRPEGGKVRHDFMWKDATGRSREVKLLLQDFALPFTRQDEFVDAIRQESGKGGDVEIRDQRALEPPAYKGGLMVEVERQRSDGTAVRMMYGYFPMGPERFALIYFQGLPADWQSLRKAYQNALASVDFSNQRSGAAMPQQAGRAGGPGGPQQGKRGAGGANNAAAGPPVQAEDWSTLEVTGSLVLAVVLLAGLFVGGKQA